MRLCYLSSMATRIERIESILRERFAPAHLEVLDESVRHVGHAGAAGGGGHYVVVLVCDDFHGQPRLVRHRLVYDALAPMMRGDIHALALRTYSPEEWTASPEGTSEPAIR
ncbi:MAG: BolA family transcriptional regulator, ral stress-responsive regulator [Candidatus Binatota bacterium]|jgi:BolA protein|nr:BolA family transcriptional regulator, ral stress-responsive regulator [Candidatus Binatota bacterium]